MKRSLTWESGGSPLAAIPSTSKATRIPPICHLPNRLGRRELSFVVNNSLAPRLWYNAGKPRIASDVAGGVRG